MPTTLRPTLLIAALIAVLAASPAFARSTTSKQAEVAPQADMAGPMPTPMTAPVTTGSVTPPPESRKKRMQDCMAIWDRGTHMTKREWRRTCNTQIDEDPNP